MTRYTITVPSRLNDGSLVPVTVSQAYIAEVVEITGGATVTTGAGYWRNDDGKLYAEPVQIIATDSADPAVWEALERIAATIARELQQEAVYLTGAPIGTQLVQPEVVS